MDTRAQEQSPSLAAALSPDKHGSEEWSRSPTQDLASPSPGLEVPASHLMEASGNSAASDRSPLQGRVTDSDQTEAKLLALADDQQQAHRQEAPAAHH